MPDLAPVMDRPRRYSVTFTVKELVWLPRADFDVERSSRYVAKAFGV